MSSLLPAAPPSNSTSQPPVALPSPLPPPKEIITTPPASQSQEAPSRPSPPSSHDIPGGKSPVSHLSPPPPPLLSFSSISDSLPKPVIVGIAVGALAVAVGITILCICCGKRRKTKGYKTWAGDQRSLSPPLPPLKDDSFSVPLQKWQQNAPLENLVLKVPEQPSPPPWFASHPPPKPPPQSVYSSSGTSGSNSSRSGISLPPPAPTFAFGFSKNTFTYEELAMATDGFSEANLLGQGGFGFVHKGTLLNGKEVAIKQLKTGSGQGEREFRAEVEIISRVHHKHLVSLVGYCISGGKRLLVYEFVRNNTMEFHLHGTNRPTMGWPTRLKIALGSAKGLSYLHEDCNPKIIHRDIKAANILIDYNFDAKVADFGLAKFASDKNTHISTRVMGTFGYLAPEYASTGKLTDKSDVFSYGVMLLELITGRQPVDTAGSLDESLVDWARPLMTRAMEDGYYGDLVDPRLGRNYSNKEMKRMIACAAACVRHSARRRPQMSQVLRAMEGGVSLEDLNKGIQPGHSIMHHDSYSSSDYDAQKYNEALQKFRKLALQSQVYTSSEYSATTSEYGLAPSASGSEGQNTREMEKMKNSSSFGSGHGDRPGL